MKAYFDLFLVWWEDRCLLAMLGELVVVGDTKEVGPWKKCTCLDVEKVSVHF